MSNELENAAKEYAAKLNNVEWDNDGNPLYSQQQLIDAMLSQTNEQGKIEEREIEAMADKILKCIKNNNPASIRGCIINGITALQLPQPKGSGLRQYLESRIKRLREADDAFCGDRWNKDKPEAIRALAREKSNEVTFARQELEEVLKRIEPTPPHQQPRGGEKVDEK